MRCARRAFPSGRSALRDGANVRKGLPPQPVDATQALNLSAGVSNSNVLRGRSFSCRAIAIYVRSWGLIPSLDDDHPSHGAKRSSRFRCPVSGVLPGRHKARRPRPALGSPAPTHPPDRYRESGPARSAGAWGSPRAIAASYRATARLTNEVQHRYAPELRWASTTDSSTLMSG